MSASILPAARPQLTQAELRAAIAPFKIDRTQYPLVVVGVRGYYRDTMGKPGANDRGVYDDAIFIDAPDAFATFNANCDPSSYHAGYGTGEGKGMASLDPGAWYVHQFALHKGAYLALCQRAGAVLVTRDGNPPYKDRGEFGINIHRGGATGTGSEGCQTVHPAQWPAFIALASDLAKRYFGGAWKQRVVPYVLLAPDHPLR